MPYSLLDPFSIELKAMANEEQLKSSLRQLENSVNSAVPNRIVSAKFTDLFEQVNDLLKQFESPTLKSKPFKGP